MTKSFDILEAAKKSTGMLLDGVFASEAIDSSGEQLDVKGADISSLEAGEGIANWEHNGKNSNGLEVVGKIVYAKKIYNTSDCDDERQLEYWEKTKLPFIYGVVRLYDGAQHQGALAIAAQIRDAVANKEKILVRFSIEGSTVERSGNKLTSTIARKVALTIVPCNKTANSGLVADPKAPEGFKQLFVQEKGKDILDLEETTKFEQPGDTRLGSGGEGGPVLEKTLEAGSYNAAPGTLTGGAALQREDLSTKVTMLNTAKAALRDYDWTRKESGREDFKKYLQECFSKTQLPDVDEDFIDHFTDLVDDYRLKSKSLNKNEDLELTPEEEPAPEPKDKPKVKKRVLAPDQYKPKSKSGQFALIQGRDPGGKKIPTPKEPSDSYFDSEFGYLHTPMGSFKIHVPDEKEFTQILNSDKVQPTHDEAMKNWMVVHKLLKEGKTPPELVTAAALFSGMSPSVAVAHQEFAFSHLLDMMDRGLDPTKPVNPELQSEFIARTSSGAPLPEWQREYWEGEGGKGVTTKEGKIRGLLYPQQKWNSVEKYHKLHDLLNNQLHLNGANGRATASILMSHKAKPKGRAVEGFAPKTIRYALSMMGSGNMVVPDTHFIRHLFGLPSDSHIARATRAMLGRPFRKNKSYEEVPFAPNEYLKRILWDAKNHHLLNEIDEFYKNHHPAYKYADHRFFGGSNSDQAIFPAFWAHWLAIPHHEKLMGRDERSFNGGTDHGVYWHHVRNIMQKYGLGDLHKAETTDLIGRCGMAHREMYDELGPGASSMFYYQVLVPRLLQLAYQNGNHSQPIAPPNGDDSPKVVQPSQTIVKTEILLLNLNKAIDTAEKIVAPQEESKPRMDVRRVTVLSGKNIYPGKIQYKNKLCDYYGIHDGEHVIQNPDNYYGLLRLPQNAKFDTIEEPRNLDKGVKIDSSNESQVPSHINKRPEQKALVHDLDFTVDPVASDKGINFNQCGWRKNAQGNNCYIKIVDDKQVGDEVGYYNLAHDFWGLGHYIPTTSLVVHPVSKKRMAVIEGVPQSEHYKHKDSFHTTILQNLTNSGDLDKILIMNSVMGNRDRHEGNFLFSEEFPNNFALIDHGFASPRPSQNLHALPPDYLTKEGSPKITGPIHPAAIDWVQKLKAEKLSQSLENTHYTPEEKSEMLNRLARIQKLVQVKPGATRADVLNHLDVGADNYYLDVRGALKL